MISAQDILDFQFLRILAALQHKIHQLFCHFWGKLFWVVIKQDYFEVTGKSRQELCQAWSKSNVNL
jgi:hypothetical protein